MVLEKRNSLKGQRLPANLLESLNLYISLKTRLKYDLGEKLT